MGCHPAAYFLDAEEDSGPVRDMVLYFASACDWYDDRVKTRLKFVWLHNHCFWTHEWPFKSVCQNECLLDSRLYVWQETRPRRLEGLSHPLYQLKKNKPRNLETPYSQVKTTIQRKVLKPLVGRFRFSLLRIYPPNLILTWKIFVAELWFEPN